MSNPTRVVVLSAGDGSGINFCNSLRLKGSDYHIIATDTNPYRLLYATGDEKHLLPAYSPEAYWDALLTVIDTLHPDFLYAADTNWELALISRRRHELPVTTFLPPQAAVEIYEDKWRSYEYFKAAGLTVPETILIRTAADVDEAILRFGKIWLRATHGSGGAQSIATEDPVLARAWVSRYDGWGRFTAAQVLTKAMATWIGLWYDGELAVCQGRRRLFWEYGGLSPSGVTGITGAQSTTSDQHVSDVALAAIRAVPMLPHGIVSVDLTFDSSGIANPTEIQASRLYSSVLFLAKAGLNLPDIYIQMGLSGSIPSLDNRIHPLPDDLLWLKAVDCMPIMTTVGEAAQQEREFRRITSEVQAPRTQALCSRGGA